MLMAPLYGWARKPCAPDGYAAIVGGNENEENPRDVLTPVLLEAFAKAMVGLRTVIMPRWAVTTP